MPRIIKLLFLKEITEARRDKRSLITVLVISVFIPLSAMIGFYVQSVMKDKAETIEYGIVGGQNDPALIGFLNARGFKTTDGENDDGVQLVIPDDYRNKLATGYVPRLTIRADFSDSTEAVRKLEKSLKAYANEIGLSRLVARGVSPIVLRPFTVNVEDTGEISVLTRYVAPMIIYMFLMASIYALMPASIDCTAGERERNGTFPLLLQPLPPISIPIGKLLMLVVTGMIALSITVTTGFIAYSNVSLKGFNLGFDMSFLNGIFFLLIALPTVMVLAAMMMGFASFAKSFKEGQAYVGLATLVPLVFVGAGFALDQSWRPYFPFWSETLVLSNLLSGEAITWLPWLMTISGYMVIVGLCMWWMSRSMRRQALHSQ